MKIYSKRLNFSKKSSTFVSKNVDMTDKVNFSEGLRCRDITAYKTLYQCYYKPLVLFALRFIDDMSAAEDIVEDVFVALWEKGDFIDSAIALKAYIYNAVRNRCINALRHQDAHSRYADEILHSGEETIDGEQAHSFEMQYIRLFEALDSLPQRPREVMLLYMEGLKNAEIAQRLSLSIDTVKVHRKRALALLRQRMHNVQDVVVFLLYLHFFNIL